MRIRLQGLLGLACQILQAFVGLFALVLQILAYLEIEVCCLFVVYLLNAIVLSFRSPFLSSKQLPHQILYSFPNSLIINQNEYKPAVNLIQHTTNLMFSLNRTQNTMFSIWIPA